MKVTLVAMTSMAVNMELAYHLKPFWPEFCGDWRMTLLNTKRTYL